VKFTRDNIIFLAKFFGLFLVLYYGTYAFIGLSTEGDLYFPWLKYIDYVSWYRHFLLKSAEHFLGVLGEYAFVEDRFYLNINGRLRIQLIYECLGIGVNSFWVAFVVTNKLGGKVYKVYWVLSGFLIITLLNISRIIVLGLALYNKWPLLAKIEHHTLYNYLVYVVIILMVWLYKKRQN